MDERATLIEGARKLGLALTVEDAGRMLALLDELTRWNRAYNLTSIGQRADMLTHHLLDSLSVHGEVTGTTLADVGTGAGFPGLPLAIVQPARRFTLIDSSRKKIRFVAHAVRVLGLANVEPVHARVEEMSERGPFDTVIARAFAPLPRLLEAVEGLCGPETRVLALKGPRAKEEIAGVRAPWRIVSQRPLEVPGLDEARHVIVMARSG
ncbi:MAG TPA: 16S rRNA (guanine(527)-N(7))-methyltransferase RsmG [Steroidobacteraceae bacterium]|nr:16S rRNA (guanine(527)-N(7))-methyltransferase RsmG [Steroidobacteraceae bacterium]